MTAPLSLLPKVGIARMLGVEPGGPEDSDYLTGGDDLALDEETKRGAMKAMYGTDFPMADESADAEDDDAMDASMVRWVRGRWDAHASGVRRRLHLVERNRMMHDGVQWISSSFSGQWREPPKPRDQARLVHNLVRPANLQRVQIIAEQRPGFKTRPARRDQEVMQRAEAQQILLEYQFDQQDMDALRREVAIRVITDGVAFTESAWDPDRGPWDAALTGGAPPGEVAPHVLRIEQVRVSANATATQRPYYWVVRRTMPLGAAVDQYGSKVAKERDARGDRETGPMSGNNGLRRVGGYELPGDEELHEEQETIDCYTVYVERNPEFLPDGLQVKVVGDLVVYAGALLFRCVPMVRWASGVASADFYPPAPMEDWLDHQVRVNALLSKWYESIRKNAGNAFLTRAGSIKAETMVAGGMTLIEVNGGLQLNEAVLPLPAFAIGNDVKEALQIEIDAFEKKSGWNDQSRGTFSSDQSGRSILAQREALERIFAPDVTAHARAMAEWAKVTLYVCQFGYDAERFVAVGGNGRPDMGRAMQPTDLDGISDVQVDAETLMPQPRAWKQYQLDDLFTKGLITGAQYMQRQPYGFLESIQTPDMDHYNRGMRIVDAIIHGQPVPAMLWQDNESIQQDVLERHILLADKYGPEVTGPAARRWSELSDQQSMKNGTMPPPAPGGDAGGGARPVSPSGAPPQLQPMLGSGAGPSVPAAPVQDFVAQNDQELAAAQFESMSPA